MVHCGHELFAAAEMALLMYNRFTDRHCFYLESRGPGGISRLPGYNNLNAGGGRKSDRWMAQLAVPFAVTPAPVDTEFGFRSRKHWRGKPGYSSRESPAKVAWESEYDWKLR